jgi:hypothetical protein
MRSQPCSFQDTPSRVGGPMNVSAFEALRTHTTELLDGFAWLTQQRLSADPSGAATVRLLYEVSYLGLTLPVVLFHRSSDPFAPHGRLPAVVASLFKASRGLFSVAVDLRNQVTPSSEGLDARLHERLEPAAVVRFADQHDHLVRRQPRRVCAAPTRLIERTISVILTGEGANPAASRLPAWTDFETLWRGYRVQDELSEALSTYRFVMDQFARSAPGPPDRWFPLPVPGSRGTFGQLTEAMLAHANSSQRQLNRLLGREDHPTPLGFPELLSLL